MISVVHYANKTAYFKFYIVNHKYIHYTTSFSTRITKSITFAFVEYATMTNSNQYKALLYTCQIVSHTHTHSHTDTHTCMYMHTYAHMHLHTHAHTRTHSLLGYSCYPIDGLSSHRQSILHKAAGRN